MTTMQTPVPRRSHSLSLPEVDSDCSFQTYSIVRSSSDEEQTPPSSAYLQRENMSFSENNVNEFSSERQDQQFKTGVNSSESVSQTEVEQYLMECSLCYQDMNDPRSLPCQHSFCHNCLQTYLDERNVSILNLSLNCPVCKRQIPSEYSSIEKKNEDVVFKPNVLTQSISKLKNKKQYYCTPCEGKKKINVPASVFCKQCDVHFCFACKEHHDEIFYNHDISEHAISDENRQKSFSSSIRCPSHGDAFQYFCCDHQLILCAHCVTGSHVSCSNVKLLSEHLDSSAGDNNISKLNTEIQSLKRICKDLSVCLENVSKHKEWGMTLIANKRREIDRHLDKIQQELEHDLEVELSAKKMEMERHVTEGQILLHSVKLSSDIMRSPLATGNDVFRLSMCQRINNELRRCQAQLLSLNSKQKLQCVVVQFAPEIENFKNLCFGTVVLRTASLKNQNRKGSDKLKKKTKPLLS